MKAMILAAGRGLRMRPLTDKTPKCLLKVGGQPLIVYQIKALAAIGIRDIIINISHLAEEIQSTLGDGNQFNVNISYSYEQTALETGGGIFKVLPILGDNPFIVLSSDIFTDYPLVRLLNRAKDLFYFEKNSQNLCPGCNHNKMNKTLAHLVVVPNPVYHPAGDFALPVNKEEIGLLEREGKEKFTFGNISLLHPRLFEGYPIPEDKSFRLGSVLFHAIDQSLITGECYQGLWFNVGTPEQLVKLNNSFI